MCEGGPELTRLVLLRLLFSSNSYSELTEEKRKLVFGESGRSEPLPSLEGGVCSFGPLAEESMGTTRCLQSQDVLAKCLLVLVSVTTSVLCQDIATKGAIAGKVVDGAGAVLLNAKVSLSGPIGERVIVTSQSGEFEAQNLIPGIYQLKAEQPGFKAALVTDISVYVGRTTSLKLTLEAGSISEVVEVTGGAMAIDNSSTAVGSNLNDNLYLNLPLGRGVASLFYLSPGVADSLLGGEANPSISGASALDNLYVVDGVNITDSAFGGIGTFSRMYGTLGVGINTTYVKEVQIKTAGFEPQYGQSEGGIVNIVTKSGSNQYHGSFYGYAQPEAFEATRLQPDDFRVNKNGKVLHPESYEGGADVGGYIPRFRDKLFFFGSFNPKVSRNIVRPAEGSGLLEIFGHQTHRRTTTNNYAFKLDYNLTPRHLLNFSIFGDPTSTNVAPFRFLNTDNTSNTSKLTYGSRNISVRYNGTLSSTWTVSGAFSQSANHLDETDFQDVPLIIDFTQPGRGTFIAMGLGFFEPTKGTTYRWTGDTTKQLVFMGNHSLGLGYNYQRVYYGGTRRNSGPLYSIPASNADGTIVVDPKSAGKPVSPFFNLFPADESCSLCPFMDVSGVGPTRVYLQGTGPFGVLDFDTQSSYQAAYAQDRWNINRFVTVLLGYRWEQERILGSPNAQQSGKRLAYSFTGQWSPRFGVTVDPFGKGRTKAFYNFGRFHEFMPLNMAERSLSIEQSFIGGLFLPEFSTVNGVRRVKLNQFGTVTPVVDQAHFINGAAGGVEEGFVIAAQDHDNPILPGTKLGYAQEHVVGFEQQLPHNFFMAVRYIDRRLKRVVEDAAVVSPESAAFFGQTYFIGNITSKLDAAVNPISQVLPSGFQPIYDPETGLATNLPKACDPHLFNPAVTNSAGDVVGAVCFEANGKNGKPAGSPGADGVPDGFPDPVRNYRAIELELNRRFSRGWQLLANWRIAFLKGNYEGHLRNDTGQTDPGVLSLFDFTAGDFNLLADQLKPGPLNTERRHIANIYGSYAFDRQGFGRRIRGLNLGAGLHLESGVPISELLAHPAYLNPGEVPSGGRGKLGRTPFFSKLDLHADYGYRLTERLTMNIVGDIFNVTNNRALRLPDQNRQQTVGVDNEDFLKPKYYHSPRMLRLGLRFEF